MSVERSYCRLLPELTVAQRRQWLARWLEQNLLPGVVIPPKAVYLHHRCADEAAEAREGKECQAKAETLLGGEGLWAPTLEWTLWYPPAEEAALFGTMPLWGKRDPKVIEGHLLTCKCNGDAALAPVRELHDTHFHTWVEVLREVAPGVVRAGEVVRWPSLIGVSTEGKIVPAYWHETTVRGGGR